MSIRRRIGLVPESILPAPLAAFALHELEKLPDGDRICHGDFHPGNLLVGPRGAVVVDWTAAKRGDPMADVARTCLLLSVGVPEPSMPALIHRVHGFGRRVVVRAYLRGYARRRPIDQEIIERWKVVRAADRLIEGIREEDAALLSILERGASKAD